MAAAEYVTGTAWEKGGVTLLARITGHAGTAITQASVSAISYEVYKVDEPPAPPSFTAQGTPTKFVAATSLTVADVVFDALQTDGRWTVDATGYNFRAELAAATFDSIAVGSYPDSQWYEIPIRFTPASGAVFFVVYRIEVKHNLYGKL